MKPDDVTSKMVEHFEDDAGESYGWEHLSKKEIIAAAFNAVISDDSPITAEWLMENGYRKDEKTSLLIRDVSDQIFLDWDYYDISINNGFDGIELVSVRTIGQLRALHAGLGIGEVGK